jgi:hypothetical protein
VQAQTADFCKNTLNKKSSNSPLYLEIRKTKYANRSVIVCCQFFLSKINRFFSIRDAKFKMIQKNKIRRIQNFRHHFFQEKLKIKFILISILKNNSTNNNLKKNYWEKMLSFPNYVYLKIGFSRKNAILNPLHEKKLHTCRNSRYGVSKKC